MLSSSSHVDVVTRLCSDDAEGELTEFEVLRSDAAA